MSAQPEAVPGEEISEAPVTGEAGQQGVPDGPSIPVPVHLTSEVYADFGAEHGPDEAALLQRKWGDQALTNEGLIYELIEDHPAIDNISTKGDLIAYLMEKSPHKTPEAMKAAHPELFEILNDHDHRDDSDILSAVARYRAFAYVSKKSGKWLAYTGKPKPSQEENPMENSNENYAPANSREAFAEGMRDFNQRIEQAQSEGDSKLANELHIKQQLWIGKVKGNQVCVGGRDPTSPNGSRGV